MAKQKGGSAPADDGRKSFELDEHKAESLRAAIEASAGGDGSADMVAEFWTRMGGELGFEPESIILPDVPESGPVSFTAIPTLQGAIESLGDAVETQELLQDGASAAGFGPSEDDDGDGVMPAIERLARLAEDSIPEGRALVRFTAQFLLDQIRHAPRWDDLLEAQQRDLGATIQENARELVRRIVEEVRANGAQPIRALLDSYSEKDGIKALLKIKPLDAEESLAAIIGLHQAQGKYVLLTVASAQDFDQEPPELPVHRDQLGLGFDAESDAEHPADDRDLAGPGQDEEEREPGAEEEELEVQAEQA